MAQEHCEAVAQQAGCIVMDLWLSSGTGADSLKPLRLGDVMNCDDVQGMGRTLFERLHGIYGSDVSQMLTVQYRMHEDIMSWASTALYNDLLTAHPSVARAHLV